MNSKIKEKLPKWVNDNKYYDLTLSNDLDSLFGCEILKQVKGWNINYFNSDFTSLGITENANGNSPIGVDLSLSNGKCFDNHVVLMNEYDWYNGESVNFNIIDNIHRENYFDKYCGSTLLMIWSLYDIPLPASDEGKMILLCIDSTYKGFYSPWPKPRVANKKYLIDYMQFPELYQIQQKYEQNDFKKLNSKYNLNGKIYLKDGYLHTDIDLEALREIFDLPFLLPKNRLYQKEKYKTYVSSLPKGNYNIFKDDINNDMYSVALTKRDFINYSVLVD